MAQEPINQAKPAAESNAADYDRHWYFAFGTSNFHPRLDESEAKIDREINRLFTWCPFWKEPVTFKDWADDFCLWDITVGVGRDFTPKTSWMIWTGGSAATIENNERYGPVSTEIEFARFTAFLTVQGYWYPWGKVDHDAVAAERGKSRVASSFKHSKPYLSLATSYVYMDADADVQFKLPLIGTILSQPEQYEHHLYQVSPRLGIELPVSENNSITVEGLYYFIGPTHGDEYNGPSFNVMFKHRF
jgi:hypothetical protein